MNRAIFLDRDNTLIHNDSDLGDPDQVRLIQGAASAVASLRGLGYRIVVVSNQGGVARGKYTEADVQAVNERVNQLIHVNSGVTVDRFYFCPFHPEGTVEKYKREHPWRKPQPGMLLQAAQDLHLDLSQSWTIGDQTRDIQAGAAAGTRTVLLTPQAASAQPPLLQDKAAADLLNKAGGAPAVMPDFVARNLIEAVRIVAQQRRPEGVEDWRNLVDTSKDAPGTPGIPAPGIPASGISPTPIFVSAVSVTEKHADSQGLTPGLVPGSATSVDRSMERSTAQPVSIPKPPMPAPLAPVLTAQKPVVIEKQQPAKSTAPMAQSLVAIESAIRQVLQELRNHRRTNDETNVVMWWALVFQLIAAVCLVAALWMGAQQDHLFLRWLGAAIMVQLITMTLVLFKK